MLNKKVTIVNKLGLHARAAAKFVAHANRFGSKIEVVRDEKTVNGKSIMGVMTLAASQGSELQLKISGDDQIQAMNDLIALIEDKFGEGE